jgi:Ca2+-binding EF-hand superfamily protein
VRGAKQAEQSPAALQQCIDALDSDNDGNIDVRELRSALLTNPDLKKAVSEAVGSLAGITEYILDDLLKNADTNNDGRILIQTNAYPFPNHIRWKAAA